MGKGKKLALVLELLSTGDAPAQWEPCELNCRSREAEAWLERVQGFCRTRNQVQKQGVWSDSISCPC